MAMKKLLFDLSVCQPNKESKFHGGGVYGFIVFEACAEKIGGDNILAYLDSSRYIEPSITRIIHDKAIEVVDAGSEDIEKVIDARQDIAVLYSPLFKSAYNRISSVPVFVTIHGLRALEMNRDRYEILYGNSVRDKLKAVIKQTFLYQVLWRKYYDSYSNIFAGGNIKFITVSNHSKYSILSHYPNVAEVAVKVLYSPSTDDVDLSRVEAYEGDPYYLIVSANRWIKNAYRALMALDELYSENRIVAKTLVTGIADNSKIVRKLKNRYKFSCLGYVPKSTLEALYKGAFAFIYPSLNEGFGYPPLEAMKYGTPVLSSSFASIPEVCGDAAIYFNPYAVEEIKNRIIMITEDEAMRREYSARGVSRWKYIKKRQDADLQTLVGILDKYISE